MAKEFGVPGGDNPHGNKKGRQRPDASFSHHDGEDGGAGVPREIAGKELAEPHFSLRGVFQRSSREAQRLFNRQKEQLDDSYQTDAIVTSLAELEAIQGNATAVRELGEFLERNTDMLVTPNYVGLYFKASLLGDETATNILHDRLQIEQSARLFLADFDQSQIRSNGRKLNRVVQACAQEHLPADEWISRYAVDFDERAELQLDYLKTASSLPDADQETIARYREDVTGQFLQGNLTDQFSWNHVVRIYDAQEDDEQKKHIFSRFVDLFKEQSEAQAGYRIGMIDKFCQLGEKYLNEGYSSAKEALWIEKKMEFIREFANQEHYPSQVDDMTRPLKIALEWFHDPTPQRIIEKVDILMGEKFSNAGNSKTGQNGIVGYRDEMLWKYASKAMQEGDLADAKEYVSALGSDNSTDKHQTFFDLFTTPQELAAVKPDELTLLYHEHLRKLFTATDIFLRGDTDEVTEFTKSLLEERKPNLQMGRELFPFLDGKLFVKGIETLYAHDREAAQQVTSDMMSEIKVLNKEQGIRSTKIINAIADIQIRYGDDAGWQLLAEQAEDNYPSGRLLLHAELAVRAAQTMQQEGIPFEE